MTAAQLWTYFKDNGHTIKDVSEKTGYAINYVYNLLNGSDPMNDRAKFRIMQAYPDTALFLLPPTVTPVVSDEKTPDDRRATILRALQAEQLTVEEAYEQLRMSSLTPEGSISPAS